MIEVHYFGIRIASGRGRLAKQPARSTIAVKVTDLLHRGRRGILGFEADTRRLEKTSLMMSLSPELGAVALSSDLSGEHRRLREKRRVPGGWSEGASETRRALYFIRPGSGLHRLPSTLSMEEPCHRVSRLNTSLNGVVLVTVPDG
ncbi:MAG: hypothetical protein U0793_24980 [Gemmataceae bacterium]